MGPDALELFERQTFRQWDRASLVASGLRSTRDAGSSLASAA